MSLKEQIIAIRDSGKTNMLHSHMVQYLAKGPAKVDYEDGKISWNEYLKRSLKK